MRLLLCFILIVNVCFCAKGQTYSEAIAAYRKQYIDELVAEPRHPIQPSEVKGISFFAPDQKYSVIADVKETPGSVPFKVPTHSGKQKPFKEYCTLTFSLNNTVYVLHAYQMMDLVNEVAHKDELFVPFKDMTNYESTYGGGRYIDLSVNDIKNGKLLIDFNKCYNPYCAYSDGFSCPIPPSENFLATEVPVGEKAFLR